MIDLIILVLSLNINDYVSFIFFNIALNLYSTIIFFFCDISFFFFISLGIYYFFLKILLISHTDYIQIFNKRHNHLIDVYLNKEVIHILNSYNNKDKEIFLNFL